MAVPLKPGRTGFRAGAPGYANHMRADDTIEVAGRAVAVSNMDKLMYPDEGVTKGDIVSHYRGVAEVLLPHLAGRPLVLRRYPDGIGAEGFVQQDAGEHVPEWVAVAEVPRREGTGTVRHFVCQDEATLVYLANQAAIELHTWLSTEDSLEHPDRLVIDLDPPEGTGVGTLRAVARRVRDLFDSVGLTPFVQATGGRGFHLGAPLDRSEDYRFVRDLAGDLADVLAERDPDQLTTAQRKQRRGDRIFLDVNRNAYGQTVVAPYSLRARPGAPVATPLDWSELGRATPNGHTIDSIGKRLAHKQDPWSDLGSPAAPRAVRKALEALR